MNQREEAKWVPKKVIARSFAEVMAKDPDVREESDEHRRPRMKVTIGDIVSRVRR